MSEGSNTPSMGEPPEGSGGGQSGGAPPPPPPGQGTPGAGGAAASSGVGQPADLMTRFLARLIDFIVLWIANVVIVGFIVVGAILGAAGGMGSMFGGGTSFLASLIGTIVSTAIFIGYFALLESNSGQTLGKMLMKIKVQGPDGQNPTMEQGVKRNGYLALYLIGIIPFIGWFLAPLATAAAAIYIAVTINNNTTTRQGWHDEFADGTKVIKIG